MIITETGRNNLKDEPRTFNKEVKEFSELSQIKIFLVDRYGKMPGMKNKIYVDTKTGGTKEVGFLHSFWNSDCSHSPVEKWYQTDWISFERFEFREFNLSELKKAEVI
jgi:hypothetical protein